MTEFWPLVLPLIAASIYVVAVLSLKRAADLGVGLWHSTIVSNVLVALLFQGLLLFGGNWPPLRQWWQPLVVGLLFLSGQIWTLFSLQKGDVSVATPVLGLKIILVGLFTTLFLAERLGWQLWTAAALATGGIALLNRSGAQKVSGQLAGKVGATILSAGIAAMSFALFDVLVQKWSPLWGLGRFLPVAIGFVGLISLAMIPLFPSPLGALPRLSLRWLGVGSSLFALQSLVFVSSIAHFGAATASNVVYSSRGLLSIVAIAGLGHWFHSAEQHLSPQILRWRFAGALLMFMAIVLVLL